MDELEDPTQFQKSILVVVQLIGVLKAPDCLIKHSHVPVAKSLVKLNLPFFGVKVEALVEELYGLLVSAQEVERSAELFQVLDVVWV